MRSLRENKIPEELATLVELISEKHRHPWSVNRGERNVVYDLASCLREEGQWNMSTAGQILLQATDVTDPAGVGDIGLPSLVSHFRVSDAYVQNVNAHSAEMHRKMEKLLWDVDGLLRRLPLLISGATS